MRKKDIQKLEFGVKIAIVGIIEITLLAIIKGAFGWYTGIVVLMADALSSCTDLLTLFASLVGLKISERRADKTFKYGYYKAETFAAFVTSLIIIYFGFQILFESAERITALPESKDQFLAVISVLITVAVTLHLSHYLKKAGEKINSLSLTNTAKEKRMDLIMESGVLVGIAANYFHIPYVEGIIGVIMSLMILRIGCSTAKESLFFLLDYFNDPELTKKIHDTIRSKSHVVKEIRDIRLRRAGTFIFGEAFLEINPYAQTRDIRNELANLKEEISKINDYLKDFRLYAEIPHTPHIRIAVPIQQLNGLDSIVAHSPEETKAYLFIDVKNEKMSLYDSVKIENFTPQNIAHIVNVLKKHKVNIVINNDMHSLLYYELRRLQNIEVYPGFSNVTDAANTVKLLTIDT
ncbi:cation diffusion facilitator family transporter [Candidatus Peregrinibacteria bacterium]|nr:cation diffusion facilitator family transporter [Candidatus Peregrinibacteria bacterium]